MIGISRNQRGVISIVALGIFSVLMILGIIVSIMISHNAESIINTNNYYEARDVADSVTEFLEQELSRYDSGYSTGSVTCNFEGGQQIAGANQPVNPLCANLSELIGDRDVQVNLEIKGRASANEHLASSRCDTAANLRQNPNSTCFVTPLPGTGDAGERCNLYKPSYGQGSPILSPTLANGIQDLDQLDYSCNWNKITSGSSSSDRVSIPLYYSTDVNTIVNPYNEDEDAAQKFLLRMRTPCLPCVYGDDEAVAGVSRSCTLGDDPSVCTNAERYTLDGVLWQDNDDILVQWQISGLCANGEECGMIAVSTGIERSAVTEGFINRQRVDYDSKNYIVLQYDIHRGQSLNSKDQPFINAMLPTFTEPKFNLFLVNALQSVAGKNVPYLEYQFLSDFPVGNPKTQIKATVRIDDNIFEKTIFQEVEKPLIDFAIQN